MGAGVKDVLDSGGLSPIKFLYFLRRVFAKNSRFVLFTPQDHYNATEKELRIGYKQRRTPLEGEGQGVKSIYRGLYDISPERPAGARVFGAGDEAD